MTTREERALKIAELEGIDLDNLEWWFITHPTLTPTKEIVQTIKEKYAMDYSSFNGLMPIVVKANKLKLSERKYYFEYKPSVAIAVYKRNDELIKLFIIKDNDEDKIQEAIIFYHENKESGE